VFQYSQDKNYFVFSVLIYFVRYDPFKPVMQLLLSYSCNKRFFIETLYKRRNQKLGGSRADFVESCLCYTLTFYFDRSKATSSKSI